MPTDFDRVDNLYRPSLVKSIGATTKPLIVTGTFVSRVDNTARGERPLDARSTPVRSPASTATPAALTNLTEMNEPLIAHIQRMARNGRSTAEHYYGMSGWAVHHNSDLWAQTSPVGEGGRPQVDQLVAGQSLALAAPL
jgi:hypothetical protein